MATSVALEPRGAGPGFKLTAAMAYNRHMSYLADLSGVTLLPARRRAGVDLILALLLGGALSAGAATVYRSVDENGVVTYSDTVPENGSEVETLVIDVPTPQLTESEQDRLEAMRETTDRMIADRERREKHRAELRQQQAASRPQVVEYIQPAYDGDSYYPVYYPYPVHRPGWRPPYPVPRPPVRPVPPGKVIGPGYDYPASLIRQGYSPQVRAAFEK